MGLTRPRAHQLQDIDYKQAVRVISTSNVTLSGGAPNEVDGVSLVLGDRILVAGQTDASQNGLYQVTTVGAGSSGTWARTATANETGEINAGMVVMVTEGTANADTQWKLTTDNPITVGTTDLTFEQASAYAFGTISANGTSIVADSVGDTVTFTPGDNITITGNATSDTVTIGVTGIALDSISNGTSNVSVVSSGGNVTVGVGGSEISKFSSSGLETVALTTSGNVEVQGQNQVRFFDTDSSHYVSLRSSGTVTANVTWTLPSSDGSDGQVLTTNGGGTLSFQDAGGGASGSSYPNSTISTLPGKDGNYDLSKTPAQTTSETPFESGVTDAFGVNLGSVFSMMDPIGSVQTAAEGEGGLDLGVLT